MSTPETTEPVTPPSSWEAFPGVDPRWSRTVEAPSHAACEPVPGTTRRWHLLDNQAGWDQPRLQRAIDSDRTLPPGTLALASFSSSSL